MLHIQVCIIGKKLLRYFCLRGSSYVWKQTWALFTHKQTDREMFMRGPNRNSRKADLQSLKNVYFHQFDKLISQHFITAVQTRTTPIITKHYCELHPPTVIGDLAFFFFFCSTCKMIYIPIFRTDFPHIFPQVLQGNSVIIYSPSSFFCGI